MTPHLGAAVALLAVFAGAGLSACGGEEWEPSGTGPVTSAVPAADGGVVEPGAAGAPSSMNSDMVEPPNSPRTTSVQSAVSSGDSAAGNPKIFYLFYADGTALPKTDINACNGTPPAFKCSFAPTLAECQKQIQAYLDKWYADLNIIFTLTRPTSGKFYTEVISSGGGAWCGVDAKVAGVAPFLCKDIQGGVSYTFLGGESAKQTAIIIAQEQAHLVGLEHTKSPKDLMYPTICSDCEGFVNQDLDIDGDRCDRKTQNSHQMLTDRMGAWPGGSKPSAFGCMTDDEPPSLKITSPGDGDTVARNFAVKVEARDDCELAKVQISVTPQALSATSTAPPFEWDLTNISGKQTITVTAVDRHGHSTTAKVSVTAPAETAGVGTTAAATAGCAVASGAFGLAGLIPGLAMLLLFPSRLRGRRRRLVTGALEGAPNAEVHARRAQEAAGGGEDPAGSPESAVTGAAAQVPLRR